MRAFLFSVALLSFASQARAQLGEARLVSAGYEYHPSVSVHGNDVNFQTFKGMLSLPVPLNASETTTLIPLLGYEQIKIDSSGDNPIGNLYTATLGLTLAQVFNKRWVGIVGGTGGFASNFKTKLSDHDLYWTLNALVLYTPRRALTWGFGGSYDQRLGIPLPIPLFALRWEPSGKFGIRGTAPASLYVAWRPWEHVTLQLAAALSGQRYHLSNDELRDTDTRLAYSVVKLGGGFRIHFTDKFHFEALGGALVARRFEQYVDGDKQGHDFLPAGPFFGGNFWFGQGGWMRPFAETTP